MPSSDDSLFAKLREFGSSYYDGSSKAAADALNDQRNWLKHFDMQKPETMDVSGSIIYILRALDVFWKTYGSEHATETMWEFGRLARELDPDL